MSDQSKAEEGLTPLTDAEVRRIPYRKGGIKEWFEDDFVPADFARSLELLARQMAGALRKYIHAQQRMLERWADGDEHVRAGVWTNLHACEDEAREALAAFDKLGQTHGK